MFKDIIVNKKEDVGVIVLNRPGKHNALTARMSEEITFAIEELSAADDVKVIVVKGGGKAFCTGGDKVYAAKINSPSYGDTRGAVEFRKDMEKYRPKAEVTYNTMMGYGRGKVVVEGLKRAEAKNDLTREGVIKAMETIKNFESGVYPPITYTSSFHGGPSACLLVKKQGKRWVPISSEWIAPK
jgi:ABC-type branched-subunit amino acid transport system substrate-binding protein